MTIARRLVVDRSIPGWYHCVSRCVRRAFLCGGEFEHRRAWIRARLMELSDVFAVDVAAYSVMSNHLHVVLHVSPRQAADWTTEQVARRWLRLFCPRHAAGDAGAFETEVRRLVSDAVRIEVLRARLSDISWFMRCLSEPIARRANREDDCTGRFWEGRFKCRRLLDKRAVVACCVYTDLNPIRAGLAQTPESSAYTSVQDRIHVRQRFEKLEGLRERAPRRADDLLRFLPEGRMPRHAEDGIWLAPMARERANDPSSVAVGVTLDVYLKLVEATGRSTRSGKVGFVPGELRPILTRLEIDSDSWVRSMMRTHQRFGNAVGSATHLAREAIRRGRRWIVRVLDVYGHAAGTPSGV